MRFFTIIFFCLSIFVACTAQQHGSDSTPAHTNALINESSPYLLQHAHNPVNWRPWNDEAFQEATKDNKLVIISVGYAACHWCHVMEHESFEDSTVAALMNEHFVAIKVDREERPDVDDVYMNACQLMSERGCGWPLNAIALPDGRPIFAGTYFPKAQWMDILTRVTKFYDEQPEKALEIAGQVTEGIQGIEQIVLNTEESSFQRTDLAQAFEAAAGQIDMIHGGRNGSPKFPMPANFLFLLDYYHLTQDEEAFKAVEVTLDQMAMGGIYDHLGGGFARYSTDAEWHAPHFEKMLYDNGQLVSLYSNAYQLTKNPHYKQVVYETLAFVERELTSKDKGFYSSLDADSEGEEGKFYVWEMEELKEILGSDVELFAKYYDLKPEGNWEHKNILHQQMPLADFAKQHNITEEQLGETLASGKEKLMARRNMRVRPGLDDKVITAWNALMLKGYVDAYRAFGEERFLQAALNNAEFIYQKCRHDGNRLTRIYKDGRATINAFLDDYAITARAFVALYQATFDEQWLRRADDLVKYAQAHFYDETSGMFFYTSDEDDPLIARKMETSDNVIPASNSMMARALFELGIYLYQDDYLTTAKQMLSNMKAKVIPNAMFYANWASLMVQAVETPYEIAIVGDDFQALRQELDQHFLPNAYLLGGKDEGTLELLQYKLIPGQTTIYVCRDKVCKLPVTSVKEALGLMEN